MKKRVLINGIGRIGKAILKQLLAKNEFEIVCINDINPYIKNIAYSINYDTTYGKFENRFEVVENSFLQNKTSKIEITHIDDLKKLDLRNIDILIDSSGQKANIKELKNLNVEKIILTHPERNADINLVLGVNEKELDLKNHKIISTSSCNATALLPALKLIDDEKEIICGDIVTIHPLLNHQRVLDGGFVQSATRDVDLNFEFGRSSNFNIIPSRTTTIKACSFVNNKFCEELISSNSLRVPTDTVGAINVTLFTKEISTKDEISKLFLDFEKNQKFPIVLNNFEALVSSDFKKEEFTTIIDHRFLEVKQNMIKLLLWYDNEWGYASKVIEILKFI
ncbi:glyceraldehyde 3-phosphate dehydrogenase NAD-binding domain-containing protein [Arcobacter vandammei]|uniref:glyceraldehyde 3-phosphate dehydrogenase NAD-binding domain-containing protein n=1 Tax=Arcobacter vandammei TaxID=2782243 RepID=UPI0018DF3903|nr:glyceraldehyde 3-phosphate dehydrogenase NAD-binding domain-containing protein [Arcobacter vandammei]